MSTSPRPSRVALDQLVVLPHRPWPCVLAPRHRRKVKRSRTLLLKITDIAARENGHARAFGYLRKVEPSLFEELILSVIENAGARVMRNRVYSGDGGVDGELV